MDIIYSFMKNTVAFSLPVLFAAIGGLFTALAGTLNIALEGLMLIGAFSSLAVYYFSGSAAAAIASAIITAAALSVLHSFVFFKLRANLFISGLAINLFSASFCTLLSEKIFKTKGVIAAASNLQLLNQSIFLALFILILTWVLIYKTPFGYRLRACEKNSISLLSLGIKPEKYQVIAIILSGVFCGIGGSFLSLNLGAYVPGMSAGRGWIALAVIFLGMRRPFGILAASLAFALAETFSIYAQGFWSLPADFILAFPYICTLAATIVVSLIPKKSP